MLFKSSRVIKSFYTINQDEKVVIDSNKRMANKIEEIAATLRQSEDDAFVDSFTGGIEATDVAALLTEDDSEGEPAGIIKAAQVQPVYDGPSPEELIEQAREEIEIMHRNAESEINSMRNEMLAQAREEGKRMGYEEGMAQAQNEYAGRQAELEREYASRMETLNSSYEKRLEEMEPEMMSLMTELYDHIFDIDLKEYKNILIHLIDRALHRIDTCENYIVRVSREDFSHVSGQKQAVLMGCIASSATLEVIEDMTLAPNECLIETESGLYDCGVGTELKELKKRLRLLSYEK